MIKIVYFDEGSATDYLTIKNGGTLLVKSDEFNKNDNKEQFEIGGKVRALFNMLFIKGEAEIKGNINISHMGESLITTSISNTILSDFFDILNNSNDNLAIEKLCNYSVVTVENSIAYFQTLTPYFSMTDGNIQVSDGFAVQIGKIYETLKSSKGYYELLAIDNNKEDKKIFRFNNKAFKNNYNIVDLTQMKLAFYGIKVGTLKESKLDFTKTFASENQVVTSIRKTQEMKENNMEKELPVFDIILAGVE